MKKLILILFLLCAKTISAQGVNYGLSLGDLGYRFNEGGDNYNHSAVSLGVCAQYVFKDSLFGLEGNLLLYTVPPVYGSSTFAFAPYFFFNVAPKNPVSLEIKLGLLVSHNFAAYTQPVNDIGPSFGFYFYFVLPHAPEMGVDLSLFLGQNYYTLQDAVSLGTAANPVYSTQLITVNLSYKILVP